MKNWLLSALMLTCAATASADTTEEPAWTPVATLGDVELRNYDAVVQARTVMAVDASSSSGFRTLADYIFGGNERQQDIAMTAPVETTLAASDNYMAFYMPRQYSMDELPSPASSEVSLHQVPARTVAVIAFSGWARDGVVQEKTEELLATLAAHGLQSQSEPILAQYNPPWTLPWNRRNEVMVKVAAQ